MHNLIGYPLHNEVDATLTKLVAASRVPDGPAFGIIPGHHPTPTPAAPAPLAPQSAAWLAVVAPSEAVAPDEGHQDRWMHKVSRTTGPSPVSAGDLGNGDGGVCYYLATAQSRRPFEHLVRALPPPPLAGALVLNL